jgi:hypothetical protein
VKKIAGLKHEFYERVTHNIVAQLQELMQPFAVEIRKKKPRDTAIISQLRESDTAREEEQRCCESSTCKTSPSYLAELGIDEIDVMVEALTASMTDSSSPYVQFREEDEVQEIHFMPLCESRPDKGKERDHSVSDFAQEANNTETGIPYKIVIETDMPILLEHAGKKLIFQVVPALPLDDPEARARSGRPGLNSHYGCLSCSCPSHHRADPEKGKSYPLFTITQLKKWGTEAAPITKLILKRQTLAKKIKIAKELNKEQDVWQLRQEFIQVQTALRNEIAKYKYSVSNLEEAIKKFYADRFGQRFAPIFDKIPIYLIAPCALHMYVNGTKVVLSATLEKLKGSNLEESFKDLLQLTSLQYSKRLMDTAIVTGDRKEMQLIGRDCHVLEIQVPQALTALRDQCLASGASRLKEQLFKDLLQLWNLWKEAAHHIWAVKVTDEQQVRKCEQDCHAFHRHLVEKFGAHHVTWYIHWIHAHLPQWTTVLFEEFGVGYCIMSTQASEHLHKWMRKQLRRVFLNNTKWKQALEKMLQIRFKWYNDLFKVGRLVRHCSACKAPGHQRNNKKCPLYHLSSHQ